MQKIDAHGLQVLADREASFEQQIAQQMNESNVLQAAMRKEMVEDLQNIPQVVLREVQNQLAALNLHGWVKESVRQIVGSSEIESRGCENLSQVVSNEIQNQFANLKLQDWIQESVRLVVGNTEPNLQAQNFTKDLSHELAEVTARVVEVQSKFDSFYEHVQVSCRSEEGGASFELAQCSTCQGLPRCGQPFAEFSGKNVP